MYGIGILKRLRCRGIYKTMSRLQNRRFCKFLQWTTKQFRSSRSGLLLRNSDQPDRVRGMKRRVYIETSTIGFLTARLSDNVVLAGHQASTREFWMHRGRYELFISDLVVQECEKGDVNQARHRIEAIASFPVLDIDPEVEALAAELIKKKAVPENSVEDAVHIAVAAVNNVDFIVTWNFKHINNPTMKRHIGNVVLGMGYGMPEICSPEELEEADL